MGKVIYGTDFRRHLKAKPPAETLEQMAARTFDGLTIPNAMDALYVDTTPRPANTQHRTKTLLSQDDLEGLIGRILLAEYPDRALISMGIESLRQYLKDIPGADKLSMTYSLAGNQVFHLGEKSIKVSPTASNEEIRQALITPTVPTANTTVTVKPQMAKALQGFGQKLSKLKHDAEFDANKLAARIDALTTRKDAAIAKSGTYLDQHEKDVADIEAFVEEIETATNGGPA